MTLHPISPWRYALAYLLWLITFAAGIFVMLTVRATFNIFVTFGVDWDRFRVRAVDQFLFFGLGILLVILLIWSEHLYRTGAQKDRLWPRFGGISAVLLGVLGFCHAAQSILTWNTLIFRWTIALLALLELATAGVIVVWLRERARRHAELPPVEAA